VSAFFAMGGYAAFVWPAYGISAVVLMGLVIISRRRLKRLETALAELESQR
jgi:heme exporter protein D